MASRAVLEMHGVMLVTSQRKLIPTSDGCSPGPNRKAKAMTHEGKAKDKAEVTAFKNMAENDV